MRHSRSTLLLASTFLTALASAQSTSDTEQLEFEPAWEAILSSSGEIPSTTTGQIVVAGDLVLTAALASTGPGGEQGVIVTLLDAKGHLLWQIDEQQSTTREVTAVLDLELAPDGDVAYTYVRENSEPDDRPCAVLRARATSDGSLLWTREIEIPAIVNVFASLAADSTGVLAVQVNQFSVLAPLAAGYDSTIAVLSESSGESRWTRTRPDASAVALALTPAPLNGALVATGLLLDEIIALDAVDGATLWQVSANSNFAHFDVNEGTKTLVYLTFAFGSREWEMNALDLESGAPLWSLTLGADGGIAGDAERVFGSGAVGVGSDQHFEMTAVDRQTGEVLWHVSEPAPINGGDTQVVHDPVADRVILVKPSASSQPGSLSFYDDRTGALVDVASYPGFGTFFDAAPAPVTTEGGLVLAPSKSSFFSDTPPILLGVDAAGSSLWELDPLVASEIPNNTRWIATHADEVHSIHELTVPASPGAPDSVYQVRSALDGSLASEWPLAANELQLGAARLSPAGGHVAILDVFTDFQAAQLFVYDTEDGTELLSRTLDGSPTDDHADIHFDEAGSRVFAVFDIFGGFRVDSVSLGSGSSWSVTIESESSGPALRSRAAEVLATTGEYVVAAYEVDNFIDRLRLYRFDPETGAVVSAPPFDTDALSGQDLEEVPLQIVELPAVDRLAVLCQGFSFGNNPVFVAEYVLTSFEPLAFHGISPVGTTARYRRGSALSVDDGAGFVVAGVDDLLAAPEVQRTRRFDTTDWSIEWERTDQGNKNNRVRGAWLAADANARVVTTLVQRRDQDFTGSPEDVQRIFALDAVSGDVLFESGILGFAANEVLGAVQLERLATTGRIAVAAGSTGPVTAGGFGALRAVERSELTDSAVQVAIGGAQVSFILERGETAAGRIYLLLGSASGISPGIPLGTLTLPLVLDTYTLLTLNSANAGPFTDTLGALDKAGTTRASIAVPPLGAGFLGLEVFHAAIELSSAGSVDFSSQPTSVVFASTTE